MRRKPKPTSNHGPVVRFLALCVVYWAIALLVLSRMPVVERFGINLTLGTTAKAFALTGQKVARSGDSIYAGGESVNIVSDCSPHVPFLIFAAVVLAFPSSWRRRLLGLGFGAIVILVFNTVRIIALIEILIVKPAWFEFTHVYLWQTGTVLVLFATFAMWLRWIATSPPGAPSTAATVAP